MHSVIVLMYHVLHLNQALYSHSLHINGITLSSRLTLGPVHFKTLLVSMLNDLDIICLSSLLVSVLLSNGAV